MPELLEAGVEVALAQDCVMDSWYPLGTGDMLDAAHMSLHLAHMTRPAAMRRCFELVTTASARLAVIAKGRVIARTRPAETRRSRGLSATPA